MLYLALGPNIWGRGQTVAAAIKAGRINRASRYLLYRTPDEEAFIEPGGNIVTHGSSHNRAQFLGVWCRSRVVIPEWQGDIDGGYSGRAGLYDLTIVRAGVMWQVLPGIEGVLLPAAIVLNRFESLPRAKAAAKSWAQSALSSLMA